MRLIDAFALAEYCNNQKVKTVDANDIMRFPGIEAVPLKPLARFLAEYAAAPFVKLTDLADREKHVKRWEEFLRGMDWRENEEDADICPDD